MTRVHKMVKLNCFGTIFTIFNILAQTSFAHICDVCECRSSRNEVFSVTCDGSSAKHFHFTSSMMMEVETAAVLTIKDCQTVSIERNSFYQLRNLNTVTIQNCLRLYLAIEAFSTLNVLSINHVQDISFGEMALLESRVVKNIIVNTSNIIKLPRFSFYDLKQMEKFSLINVNIDSINKNALNITARSVQIESLKVNYTEVNGLVLKAEEVNIEKCEFGLIAPGAIQITTEIHTRLLENDFNDHFHVNITSPFAELFGNRFQSFDVAILPRVQKSEITNNLILHTDYEKLFKRFKLQDFFDNHFICRCGMNLLNAIKTSANDGILKKNYCMANCTLSLFDFETESLEKCTRHHKFNVTSFCIYERNYKAIIV